MKDPNIIAANGVPRVLDVVFKNAGSNVEHASECKSFPYENMKPCAVAKVAGKENKVANVVEHLKINANPAFKGTCSAAIWRVPGGKEQQTNSTQMLLANRVIIQAILPLGTILFGFPRTTMSQENARDSTPT